MSHRQATKVWPGPPGVRAGHRHQQHRCCGRALGGKADGRFGDVTGYPCAHEWAVDGDIED